MWMIGLVSPTETKRAVECSCCIGASAVRFVQEAVPTRCAGAADMQENWRVRSSRYNACTYVSFLLTFA